MARSRARWANRLLKDFRRSLRTFSSELGDSDDNRFSGGFALLSTENPICARREDPASSVLKPPLYGFTQQ